MRFRRCGAYSAPPDPLAGFNGPTSKGREGKKGEGKKGRGGKRMKGRGREMEGLLIRGGREVKGGEEKKGEGRSPRLLRFPPDLVVLE